jgi:dTDP-L-rhamnose 4-epimerase
MIAAAAAAGWRIAEVDVAYAPRTGRSKVTGSVRGTLTALHDMREVLARAGAR